MIKTILKYVLLSPLTIIYNIITETRNKLYDWEVLHSEEFNFPIISVGNLTIGGTGKTPHIEYLIKILQEKNYRVAVLSRGYKRKAKGFQDSNEKASLDSLGDELYQMYLKFPNVSFYADANRVKGVRKILLKNDCDVILLDDAFQHRKINPGLSILLNDYNRPFYEDHVLPLGNLRENEHQKKRAQIVITTKSPIEIKPIDQRIVLNKLKLFPYQDLYFTSIRYKKVKQVFDSKIAYNSLDDLFAKYKNVLLFTGIAQPKQLEKEIKNQVKEYKTLIFPDHHFFSFNDIDKIETEFKKLKSHKIILTTEKDASRLKELKQDKIISKKHYFYVEIEIDFLKEKETFNHQIYKYVANNRRKF